MNGTRVNNQPTINNINNTLHSTQNPGSRHTRSSSVSSNLPRRHERTSSTDHPSVPDRADTAPQRRRKDSLDALKLQDQSIPHQGHPSAPFSHARTPSRSHCRPPLKENSVIQATLQPQPSKQNRPREIPRTPKPRSATLPTLAESYAERHTRLRKLSSREMLYPTPEAAKQAFELERAQRPPPTHRRPPTPHTSTRRTSGSVRKVDSDRSIRSRVSFDSTRSRRSDRSRRSRRTDGSDSDDATIGGDWEPSFGATSGIGPAGEAIEVIGLGRKKPRHRTFNAGMLKPALRSTSRINSRANLRDNGGLTPKPLEAGGKEKPLPTRPMSYVASTIGETFSRLAPTSQKRSRHASHQPQPSASHSHYNDGLLGASASVSPRSVSRAQASRSSQNQTQNTNPSGIRSLFSSLSLGNGFSANSAPQDPGSASEIRSSSRLSNNHGGQALSITPSRTSRRQLIAPAEDLFTYLKLAEISSWDRWPLPVASQGKSRGIWGGKRSLGVDDMGWEWHRRLAAAEEARMAGRGLGSWESFGRGWERGIIDFLEENVPHHPIDIANRWGTQIFALPAEGYDTLEFYDEAFHQAEDFGLLSWVTGTLLQTAVSTLHMLRYSSQTFTFHLIPSPRPPHLHHSTSSLTYDHPSPSQPHHSTRAHYLWEGFGTMVLVNKSNDVDRAMILEIRPPSVVDSGVMKEFAKGKNGEGWWAFYGETCVGDVGQANLLQAQVYDSCIQNQVYFFAVTNLKYWIFGQFNPNYTRCTVSTVIDRRGRDPSLMQCLTAWVVRSVDERPRGKDSQHGSSSSIPSQLQAERDRDRRHRRPSHSHAINHTHVHTHGHGHHDVPPYPDGAHTLRSRHHRSNSYSSLAQPNGEVAEYDHHPSTSPFPQPDRTHGNSGNSVDNTAVYPVSTPNGTQTVFPVNMTSANPIVPAKDYGNYGLPNYNDLPPPPPPPLRHGSHGFGSSMSPGPYSQPGAGMGMMGMTYGPAPGPGGMGWGGAGSGSGRAFSPTPSHGHAYAPTPMPYNFGTSWYGGEGMFSWPGSGMR